MFTFTYPTIIKVRAFCFCRRSRKLNSGYRKEADDDTMFILNDVHIGNFLHIHIL